MWLPMQNIWENMIRKLKGQIFQCGSTCRLQGLQISYLNYHLPDWTDISHHHTEEITPPPQKKHWKYKNKSNGSRARKNIFLSITFLEHTDVFCVNTSTGLVCLLILHSIKLILNQNWEALLMKWQLSL